VTGALRQGALADTMNRFPFLAKVFKMVMPGTINAMIEDTRTHEAHTMDLIERYTIPQLGMTGELTGDTRRVNNPTDRPDFLTRILENRKVDEISNVQLAAHASDFVLVIPSAASMILGGSNTLAKHRRKRNNCNDVKLCHLLPTP
jgi:hypothetical protein